MWVLRVVEGESKASLEVIHGDSQNPTARGNAHTSTPSHYPMTTFSHLPPIPAKNLPTPLSPITSLPSPESSLAVVLLLWLLFERRVNAPLLPFFAQPQQPSNKNSQDGGFDRRGIGHYREQ